MMISVFWSSMVPHPPVVQPENADNKTPRSPGPQSARTGGGRKRLGRISRRQVARQVRDEDQARPRSKTKWLIDLDALREQPKSFGAIQPRDPDLLLDAWREDYRFSKHRILRGHVAARTGEALLGTLSEALHRASVGYAATGLAGAWLLDRFAGFRITTLYLADDPPPAMLDSLSFREEDRGANVWLVVPNDEGIFHGATAVDSIQCAHPVQVYLDLQAHPERADEAAKALRANHLRWSTDA